MVVVVAMAAGGGEKGVGRARRWCHRQGMILSELQRNPSSPKQGAGEGAGVGKKIEQCFLSNKNCMLERCVH